MIGRRGMMRAIGLAPFIARRRRVGWEENSIFQVLIVPSSPGAGVFVYSGAPGFAKLIASITATAGKDPFGNATVSLITAYDQSIGQAVQINGDTVQFYGAPGAGGPYTQRATVGSDGAGDLILATNVVGGVFKSTIGAVINASGADQVALSNALAGGLLLDLTNTTAAPTAANLRLTCAAANDRGFGVRVAGDTANRMQIDPLTAGGRLQAGPGNALADVALYRAAANQWAGDYAAFNNAGAAETWQTVGGTGAAFAGTWANAAAPGVPLQYRRNMAPYKSVQWVGRVTNTVAQAANSAITAAVAAAYRPANTHDITCFNITTGAVVRVSVGSTGVLTCQSAIAANDVVGIPDTSLGLDA